MRTFVALSMTTILVLSSIAGCGKSATERQNEAVAAGLATWAHERVDPKPSGSDPEVSSLGHAIPGEPVHPYLDEKEQAAVAGVPEVIEASKPVHAVMIMHCRKLVGLAFIGADGSVHDTPLEGLNKAIVEDLLSQVPADQIDAYVVPCGGTDGTPI